MDEHLVSRRSALKYLGLLTASVAGREFLASWLPVSPVRGDEHGELVSISGMHHEVQEPQPAETYTPQFFNAAEFHSVEILSALIIPTDDAPGAKEAQVANYIDFVVFSAAEFEPSLQKEWTEGLAFLEGESQRKFKESFRESSDVFAGAGSKNPSRRFFVFFSRKRHDRRRFLHIEDRIDRHSRLPGDELHAGFSWLHAPGTSVVRQNFDR